MSYTLEGRALGNTPKERAVAEAPCIFCGRVIGHFNDAGPNCVGWVLGALVDGKPDWYLYCGAPPCDEVRANETEIWRCGCESDYIENVGSTCHGCRRARADAVPVTH